MSKLLGFRRLHRNRQYAQEIRAQMANGDTGIGWPRNGQSLVTLKLVSADEALHFNANISFWARWVGPEAAPPALLDVAKTGILHRAENVSSRHRLTAAERLKGELNTALLNWETVASSSVQARGYCVSIEVVPELLAIVEEHQESVRQRIVLSSQDLRRRHQQDEMISLILDPLRATASWLRDNQDKPEAAVKVAQNFQELRDSLVAEIQPDSAGKLVDEFLTEADDAVRSRTARLLRNFFHKHERGDLAARLPSFDE